MRNLIKTAVLASLLTGSGLAQELIATVTSLAPFQLRGATLTPGQGVPNWPVMTGDIIKSGTSQTLLTFKDGSAIALNPAASATLGMAGKTPVFQLLSGTAVYSLKTKTAVQISAGSKILQVASLNGTLAAAKAAGAWTLAQTALTIGGGAAAAASAGLSIAALQANSVAPQVSPSQ